jgi:transposase
MMTEEQINAVAVMRRAGNSNREIAQTLGMTYDQVGTAVFRARKRNILPPKPVAEPKQAIIDFCKSNNIRQGRISNMMLALSKEEKVWLVGEAHKDGYETIAEFLTDLVREKYDQKNEL